MDGFLESALPAPSSKHLQKPGANPKCSINSKRAAQGVQRNYKHRTLSSCIDASISKNCCSLLYTLIKKHSIQVSRIILIDIILSSCFNYFHYIYSYPVVLDVHGNPASKLWERDRGRDGDVPPPHGANGSSSEHKVIQIWFIQLNKLRVSGQHTVRMLNTPLRSVQGIYMVLVCFGQVPKWRYSPKQVTGTAANAMYCMYGLCKRMPSVKAALQGTDPQC